MRQLANIDLRHAWLVFSSLVVQLLGIALLSRSGGSFNWVLLIATGLPLIAFLIVNRSLPGAVVIAAGFSLNLLVIAINGAMPVSPQAARSAGVPITREAQGPRHEVLSEETRLSWLADVVPVPALGTVVSVGDIVLAGAVGYMLFRGAGGTMDRKIKTTFGSEPAKGP